MSAVDQAVPPGQPTSVRGRLLLLVTSRQSQRTQALITQNCRGLLLRDEEYREMSDTA